MQDKFLGMTPPLGWNSWNTFTWNINDQLIRESADAMVESGLKDAGYEYVVIDDCWSLKQRDEKGYLVPDPEKFPQGMKAVADYVHSKGLKFGMYSCCGTHTCAGYPGSFEHEFQDAETFASWGVDYLKYDNCYKPLHADGEILYKRMSLALRNCGRDILFSACNWGSDNVHQWIQGSGAQRVGGQHAADGFLHGEIRALGHQRAVLGGFHAANPAAVVIIILISDAGATAFHFLGKNTIKNTTKSATRTVVKSG